MTVILAGGFSSPSVWWAAWPGRGCRPNGHDQYDHRCGHEHRPDPIFIFTFDGESGGRGSHRVGPIALHLSSPPFRHYSTYKLRDPTKVQPAAAEVFYRCLFLRSHRSGKPVFIVVYRSLGVYGTELHIAIYGVAHRVTMFLLMPLIGIVQGLQPIIGFNYGATRLDRVKEALKLGMVAASAMATFGFIVVMLFTEPLVRLLIMIPVILHGVPVVGSSV